LPGSPSSTSCKKNIIVSYKTLNFYYVNARSICKKKRNQFTTLLATLDYDVVVITETWLDDSVTNGMISISGAYCVHRCDRGSRAGGVAIFAKHDLETSVVPIKPEYSGLEILAVDFSGDSPLRVIGAYRPPHCDNNVSKLLWECITDLTDCPFPTIIVGDFNLPDIIWYPTLEHKDTDQCIEFLAKVSELGLEQYVTEPTHKCPKSEKSNFLDLIFCTDEQFVFDVKVSDSVITTDHACIEFSSIGPCVSKPPSKKQYFRDFENANWKSINDYLSTVTWDNLMFQNDELSTQDLWNIFISKLHKAIELFVPLKEVKPHKSKKQYPKYLSLLIKEKKKLYKQRVNRETRAKYNRLNKKIKRITDKIALNRENKILQSDDKNRLYKYVRKNRCNDNGIAPLKTKQGKLVTDESQKAKVLNQTFAKNFTVDNGSKPKFDKLVAETTFIDSDLNFTSQKVRKVLSGLKNKKSRTPDDIPAIFFKSVADNVCYPLSILFQKSFESGTLPSIWKLADVVALFKKGDASDPGNYRPVSLTSISCKIMETCIYDEIIAYMRQNNLLSRHQHGFLKRRSTCTQLIECLEDWTKQLENKNPTDVIYVDFRKAFDSVSHDKLLLKLEAYGIKGKLLDWIREFLSNRKQRVCLGNFTSNYVPVTSGIPQGSILGPLLFLIYVNDLPEIFEGVTCKLFADDLKLYGCAHDFEKIQKALEMLAKWAKEWQLGIAVQKCGVLHIGDNNPEHAYSLLDKELPIENCFRDLGVYVSSDLKVASQCFEISKKANRVTNMLFNCFQTRNYKTLLDAFKIYVRSIVEYCTPAWNPYLQKDLKLVENVQRYYTRRLFARCGLDPVSYPERLEFLGLKTLEERRLYYDLSLTYNIIHKENDLKFDELFTRAPVLHDTRGHPLKLRYATKVNLLKVRINAFSQRTIKVWNSLPKFAPHTEQPIVNASNIKLFKQRITKLDLSTFLNYSTQ